MDSNDGTTNERPRRRWVGPAALLAGGLVAGAVVAGTLPASAADSGSSSGSTSTTGSADQAASSGPDSGTVDESQPQRADEKLLTGDTADKVEAAALAKYPGATVLRIETDSDGVYEAHLTKSDGTRVTVEVDASFTVTGDEAGPAGGPGGPGGRHGAAPDTEASASASASASA